MITKEGVCLRILLMYLYLILDGMARYNAPFSKISKIHHFMEEAGEKMQRTHEKNPMSANRMLRGAIKAWRVFSR